MPEPVFNISHCNIVIRIAQYGVSTIKKQKTAGRECAPAGGLLSVYRRSSGFVVASAQGGFLSRPAGALVDALMRTAFFQERIDGQGITRPDRSPGSLFRALHRR